MKTVRIDLPLNDEVIRSLEVGDVALLNGYIYTARDAAHQRLYKCYEDGVSFPLDLRNQTIYYVGPAPAKPPRAVGSAGPTTSSRMDFQTPMLLDHGLKGMIGKGVRSEEVKEAMVRNCAVYFVTIGGTAAVISKNIVGSELICYDDLGTEAIRRFEVKDFPVYVAVDCRGNDLYQTAKQKYRKETI